MWPRRLASCVGFLGVGISSGLRMLRCLGLRGMIGFARAAKSVGAPGKDRVAAIVACFNTNDAEQLLSLVHSPDTPIQFPVGFDVEDAVEDDTGSGAVRVADWALLPGNISLDKILAAGDVVAARMTYRLGDEQRVGVALFQLDRTDLSLVGLSCYW